MRDRIYRKTLIVALAAAAIAATFVVGASAGEALNTRTRSMSVAKMPMPILYE